MGRLDELVKELSGLFAWDSVLVGSELDKCKQMLAQYAVDCMMDTKVGDEAYRIATIGEINRLQTILGVKPLYEIQPKGDSSHS